MMNIDQSFIGAESSDLQGPPFNKETHKTRNSKVINSLTKNFHAPGSSEHNWDPDNDSCEVTNDVTLSTSNICIGDISAENCDDNHETNSNSSQSESLSFLDGLLDLASSFSQPQKNVLQTPELQSSRFSKSGNEFVMSPPTPTLQVSPKVVIRFTDIRSGLGRAALSTSFEENRSPTDVTLRNITKMLCSPRSGTRTPHAVRRVSAGVPPTSSVARKMEFSPQTKSNKRHNRLTDIYRFPPSGCIDARVDHDALLSSTIFADGDDEFANVPKPTRNLYIPDVLLSSGSCRSDSVGFRTSTADVCSASGGDCHITESWQFGIMSPPSVVTTFDIGPSTNSETNSSSCGLAVSQGVNLSHPEFNISPPSKTSSSFGLNSTCYRSGFANLSPPLEIRLPDSLCHSGSALPHISTFSHLSDAQQKSCKSAFTPVVRSCNVCHNMSNFREESRPLFTSVTSLTSSDTLTCPPSMTPVKHKTFSPVDMPSLLPSPFLVSPPPPGLEQFCYPNNMFVSSREHQNGRESELMTPVLDRPVSTPSIGEESDFVGHTKRSGSSSASILGMLPSLYLFEAGSHCIENTASCNQSVRAPNMYTDQLPVGGRRNAYSSSVEDQDDFRKLIKASDSFGNYIDLHHAKSSSANSSLCGKNGSSGTAIPDYCRNIAVDPMQLVCTGGDSSSPDKATLNMSPGIRRGSKKKRPSCVTWNKPESVREALEKRRKQAVESCTCSTTSCISVVTDACPALRPESSTLNLTEPTVVLASSWANGRSSRCSSSHLGSCGTNNNHQLVAPCAQQGPTGNMMTKCSKEHTSGMAAGLTKNFNSRMPFGQKDAQSLHADSLGNPNISSATMTKTTIKTAQASCSVPSARCNDYDLIGEPQICKTPLYLYNSHIRNPKKEMIQRQVYENSRRQTTSGIMEMSNSVAAVTVSAPVSTHSGSGGDFDVVAETSDADTTAAKSVSAVDPSKNCVTSHSDRFSTYIQSMSANPMYPQIMKFVREYEQLMVASQPTVTSVQLTYAPGSGGASSTADGQKIASVQNDVGITVGSVDVTTVSSTSDLAETRCYYPIFAKLTDEQLGSYLTSKTGPPPKPRNFHLVSLQIGTFRYYAGEETNRKEAKVKVMFSKRKVIYELELQRSDEDRQEARCPFTVIEIPFGSIVGLNGSGTTVLLELNMMAYMFLGFRSCDSDGNFIPRKIASYNRNMHVDLTGQQLEIMPYHQITLKKNGADKFVQCLARFDKRFFLLQYIPIMFNPTKRLGPWPPHAYVSPLLRSTERYAATFRQRQQAHSGCNCAAGCQFTRCRCVMAQLRCTDSCRCIAHLGNCVNTINQMETLGLDVSQCKKDVCLMANVFRIKNLATYLQKSVTVQCCGIMLPLRSCIPGHVACPNTPFCHQTYKYSWCNGKLYSDRDGARNHCSICCICKEPNSVHCKTCNICYNPLLLSSYCPCSQAVIRSRHLQRTSSLDSRGSTDRSNKNSPDSPTSSATSVGGSAQSPVIISPTTTDESVSADDRRVVASSVERVAVESTQGVESHTDQKVILVKTERHQDSSKMLKCQSNVLRKPAVSIATTDGMPSLPNKQPGSGTQSVAVDATWTGDSLARGQGEAGAVPLGAFLQLVPATDTGQYQTLSAVRRLNGRATQDAFTGRETSRNGFELFCGGRHRSSEAASDRDTTSLPTGVRTRDSCGGSSSSGGSGMSSESDSRSPALCDSVVIRTPDCEAREENKPEPSAGTALVPVATDVERFRSDAAIVTTPVSARSVKTSTSEDQCSSRKTAGRVCSSNASKRTLSPHRETVVRKKTTKHMAGGRNAYLYTNHCVVAHDGNATRSDKTPERCDGSRASPFSGEQLDTVSDIILPSGWPAHGSCPVEAVLGKPLGTSSPIRRSHQTRPVSPK